MPEVVLSDELAKRLPEIVDLCLRQLTPLESQVFGEVLDFLSRNPNSQQIIEFKLSEAQRIQVHELLNKKSSDALSEHENAALDLYERLEHIVIMLKARTRQNLPFAQ